MQFGIFTVGDVTTDPTTGRTPTEHERIKAMVAMAWTGWTRIPTHPDLPPNVPARTMTVSRAYTATSMPAMSSVMSRWGSSKRSATK